MPSRWRVITYIDGFNLYFGLKDAGWRRFLWLDLPVLANSLIRERQELIETKYFTSRVVDPPEKKKRQSTYLLTSQIAAHNLAGGWPDSPPGSPSRCRLGW